MSSVLCFHTSTLNPIIWYDLSICTKSLSLRGDQRKEGIVAVLGLAVPHPGLHRRGSHRLRFLPY